MLCLTLEPRSAGRSTKEDPLCNGEFLTNILAEGYYYYYLSTRNQIVFLFSAKNDENVNLSGSINCVIRSTIDGAGVKTFRIEVTKNFIFKFWTTFVVVIQANCQLHFFCDAVVVVVVVRWCTFHNSQRLDVQNWIARHWRDLPTCPPTNLPTFLPTGQWYARYRCNNTFLPTYPSSYLEDNAMLGIGEITPSYQPTQLPT